MQAQSDFDFTIPLASTVGMPSEQESMAIRAVMCVEEINSERQGLINRGMQRFEAADRTGLGGPRGHQGCGTAFWVLDWMTDEECTRFHHLGLALPTSGEEVAAARQRIQERIALRRAKQQAHAGCQVE